MLDELADAAPELPVLNMSNRLRRSPLFDRVKGAGAKAWSVYNRTVIGQWFASLEEDYAHLKRAVQVWDVGGQRIVEVSGPDATRLIQMTTPRDLAPMQDDQCYYIPMVDADGRMINDPLLVKVSDGRFWICQADGDMLMFLKGLAGGLGLDVTLHEPDVWTLAIQGPLADWLAERVFGKAVWDIRFFRHARVDVLGQPMILARAGWSKQGGYELHIEGSENAGPIWDRLMEAGDDLGVRAGCPNLIERIEGGLLSFGNDMSPEHTPFEAGLARFCDMDHRTGCIAWDALKAQEAPLRQIRPVEIAGAPVSLVQQLWDVTTRDGAAAGKVSSAAWSPDFGTNVAVGMIDRAHWDAGTQLVAHTPDGTRDLVVKDQFWGR